MTWMLAVGQLQPVSFSAPTSTPHYPHWHPKVTLCVFAHVSKQQNLPFADRYTTESLFRSNLLLGSQMSSMFFAMFPLWDKNSRVCTFISSNIALPFVPTRDGIFYLLLLYIEMLFYLLCRYYISGRHQEQPQYRWRQCWRDDRQSECQRQPHGPSGGHQRQPEWDGVHHGSGWSQHHRQSLWQCHGQLLKQVLKQTLAMGLRKLALLLISSCQHTLSKSAPFHVVRLEVQADVQKERCSLSGESGTVSLGTISDNASTKAMAGSILNAYMPLDRWASCASFLNGAVREVCAVLPKISNVKYYVIHTCDHIM